MTVDATLPDMKALRVLLAALAMAAGGVAVVVVDAAPAVATTCYWITQPTSSNCDFVDPSATTCQNDATTVRSKLLTGTYPYDTKNPAIELRYSPSCRTVWARIIRAWGYIYQPPSLYVTCYAYIYRNDSIHTSDYKLVGAGQTQAYTRMLYDAGITSYAHGRCDYSTSTTRLYLTGDTGNY